MGTSRGSGGAETHMATLASALSERGDTVSAVIAPESPIEGWLAGTGVRVLHGIFVNAGDPRGFMAVARAIRREHPDWIVGGFSKEYWPLAALAHAARVPLALFKHVDFPMRAQTRRFIPRLAARFIVVSEAMRRSFVARGVPAEQMDVLPNPIDTRHFRSDAEARERMRGELGYGPGDVVAGYLGRFSSEKGIWSLADALDAAMSRAPALRALWAGNGPDEGRLRERLAASPHAVRHTLLPFTPDVVPTLSALDVLALPSLIAESFGRIAAEAQACGVPVLGSRIGGIPEAIQGGVTGLLVPPGDTSAWSDALVGLAVDPGERRRMAAAGPRFVREHFDARVVAEAFRRLLLQPRGPAAAPSAGRDRAGRGRGRTPLGAAGSGGD